MIIKYDWTNEHCLKFATHENQIYCEKQEMICVWNLKKSHSIDNHYMLICKQYTFFKHL